MRCETSALLLVAAVTHPSWLQTCGNVRPPHFGCTRAARGSAAVRASAGGAASPREVPEAELLEAVQRAQRRKEGGESPGGSDPAGGSGATQAGGRLVSLGEVAREGVPLLGLEQRLFRLAAKHRARIVTSRAGEVYFGFDASVHGDAAQHQGGTLKAFLRRGAPIALFVAAESFFLLFPVPFLVLRAVAMAFAVEWHTIPWPSWLLFGLLLLPSYVLKQAARRSLPAQARRANFVVRWARKEGLLQRGLSTPGGSARDASSSATFWRRIVEDVWPWERDPNQEIRGPWRMRILAELAIAHGGSLTAAQMSPFLDPDPDRHSSVDDFLADADGLAQPYVAAMEGVPKFGGPVVTYQFPDRLRYEAVEPSPTPRAQVPWYKRFAGKLASALKGAAGHGRVKLPSYLEELPAQTQAKPALRAQFLFCALASLWIPVSARFGLLGRRVGLVPAAVALRAWPVLLAVAAGLLVAHLEREKAAARETAVVARRNQLRYDAAWRWAERLGAAKKIPVDMAKECWYDTAEAAESFDMRRFDDRLGDASRTTAAG